MAQPIKLWKILLPAGVIVALAAGGLVLMKGRGAPAGGSGSTGGIQADGSTPPKRALVIPGGLRVGVEVPEFQLGKLDGSTVSVKQLGAKVILVNFWATWCQACLVEMPSLVRLHEAYKDKGFQVAAVNVDEDPAKVVPQMVEKLKMTFSSYLDRDQKLSELFDVSALPLTVVLDKNLRVLLIVSGEQDWNSSEIKSQLEAWLSS